MPYSSFLTIMRPDLSDQALMNGFEFSGGAHLMVLVVAKAPPAPISAYDMVNSTAWLEAADAARDWAETRANEVETLLSRHQKPGAVTAHVAGPVHLADLVAAASRCTDLVLMPVAETHDNELEHAIINGALFESGTPILVYPIDKPPAASPGIALVAWKATPESGRAVRQALPLLKAAKNVVVVLIDPQPGPRGHGDEPGADIAAYLGHHGIAADVLKVPSEGRTIEEELIRQVSVQGADLLVTGAYGHSRLRERVFGGTTQAMLSHPPCAVLLAH